MNTLNYIYLIPAALFTFKVAQIYYSGVKNFLKKINN